MIKNLLLLFIASVLLSSCEEDKTPNFPRQLQIETITFTELPKFIDLIDYDEMTDYEFGIQFTATAFQELPLTGPYDLKDPTIYNSTDGLLQPLVFQIKDDLLPYPPGFDGFINFRRPNLDREFTDIFFLPDLDYNEIYNDDLASEFEYEYVKTLTPQDEFGRLDGTFRFVVKGKFFY